MIIPIERNHPIFKSADFLEDAPIFNVMVSIAENTKTYPQIRCFSDGKDCIILNSDKYHPIAVWTSDYFQNHTELLQFLQKEFDDNMPFCIFAKKELLQIFQNMNAVKTLQFLENVYTCSHLNEIEYCGHADNITESELPKVSELLAQFYEETGVNAIEPTTKETCDKEALNYINDSLHKVWRNPEGKIVTLGRISETTKTGRVGSIMTDSAERGKSYAKMLVHFLTSQILKNGKQALLFADAHYISSNKCYQAVGYQLYKQITAFILFKEGEK